MQMANKVFGLEARLSANMIFVADGATKFVDVIKKSSEFEAVLP
jgi:hypothetical protein